MLWLSHDTQPHSHGTVSKRRKTPTVWRNGSPLGKHSRSIRSLYDPVQWLKYKFGAQKLLKKFGPCCKLKGPISTCSYH